MAQDIFIKIDTIDGESTDEKHPKWIEVESFNTGESMATAGTRSSGGAASAGRVNFQEFSFTKVVDAASPGLFLACCKGQHIPKIVVEWCRATGDKTKWLEVKMENVMIASVTMSGNSHSDELPHEQVCLNFDKITWTYSPTDHKSGKKGSDIVKFWSAVENKGG